MTTTRKVNSTNEGIITYSHESLFCFLLSIVEDWALEKEEQYQIRRNGNSDKPVQEERKLESSKAVVHLQTRSPVKYLLLIRLAVRYDCYTWSQHAIKTQ